MIKIAVDAMGGDNSPKKVIDGIIHHHKSNTNTFYQIFGDKEKIQNYINQLPTSSFEIIPVSYTHLTLPTTPYV